MKLNSKKMRGLILLFVMMAGMLAAASGVLAAPANRGDVIDIPFKAEKPTKFTMSFSDHPAYPYKDTWTVFKDIQAATNVELDITFIPMSDYTQKRNLLITSGDAPLIMPKTYPGQEVPYIPSGQILPVSDYIDDMPNFKATIEAWKLQPELATITKRDGKFYVLPGFHQTLAVDYSFAIRADVLKKHNLAIPESWDEIEKVLRELKKLYPDVFPWSDRWQLGATLNVAGPAFGVGGPTGIKTQGANWNNNNAVFYNEKTDEFFFYPLMKEYREMLTYFARLVKDGLLDPESATQTDDQAVTKFINGKSFFIATNGQMLNDLRTKMKDTIGEGKYEVIRINIPAGPAGANIVGTRLENGVMISAKAKDLPNFKDLLKFVDWVWYSYSGQEMCKWGIEGKTYSFADGKYSLLPGMALPPFGFAKKADSDIDIRTEYGYAGGNFILSYGGASQLQVSLMTPETRAWVENVNKTRTLAKPAPVIFYTEEQIEAQNMIQQPLMDFVFAQTYKFILGQADLEKDWAAFEKQCKAMGSDKYIATANEVYKASKKK